MFVTVYQTNPVFSTLYYSSSTKAVRHFCRTALLFRLYFNRLHTRDILLQPQEIRFIEMSRHGNVQHDFYRTAFLPLEIDLSHGDFPLLQSVIQAHKTAFAVYQTDHAAAVHANHARAKEADTGRNACRHTRNVNRNTGCSHDRQKTIRGDQRHQCRTERNHHVYADRRLSCVSAAPQRSAAPDRSFEYFPAYASPFRIKTIAQTTDTAFLGRSVCRYRPLRACRIPSRKHGIPSGLRFPPET